MNKDKTLKLLRLHEGVRYLPYYCSAGYLTIGVGHNLDSKPISDKAVNQILHDDLSDVLRKVEKLSFWNELNDIRKHVIIDMCFNLGYSGMMKFKKMIVAITEHDYKQASIEMLDSKWARQVGKRAERLSDMMESGDWPDEVD